MSFLLGLNSKVAQVAQPETMQDSGIKLNRSESGRVSRFLKCYFIKLIQSVSDKVIIKGSPDRQQMALLPTPAIQEGEMLKPQSSPRYESSEAKKVKHAKILAQINYFINGSKIQK